MRAHSTTVDPKCDILSIPDVVLGAGEAMRRREFITLLGGAAAGWPVTVRAQQAATPLIGFLSSRSPNESEVLVAAFRQGLAETGFVEGQNVHLAFRWAEGRYDRLPELAAELVKAQVAVIASVGGSVSAQAAKAATKTIPIVAVTTDPVTGFSPLRIRPA